MKIYFSHDLDEPRADVVRNHWLARPGNEEAGYFGALTWGDATRGGPATMKRLLSAAFADTSVTCVLIGPETAGKRWVRFEIIESLERRNLLVGVHVGGIPDRSRRAVSASKNPFEGLAIAVASDGASIKVLQYEENEWVPYEDKPGWPLARRPPVSRWGKLVQLSSLYRVYDWVADNGQANFEKWIGLVKTQ